MKTLLMVALLLCSCMAFGQRASLSDQKICADESRKAFETTYSVRDLKIDSDYVNHYDAASKVCYILVSHFNHRSDNDRLWFINISVHDVFEGTQILWYSYTTTHPRPALMCEGPADLVERDCTDIWGYVRVNYGLQR